MADVKLTKTELRLQQLKLGQLQKYLPTLQLKKALLQMEVNQAQAEVDQFTQQMQSIEKRVEGYSSLFSDRGAFELFAAVEIQEVEKEYENIAGLDIPIFKGVIFKEPSYALFDTPVWLESAIGGVKELLIAREKIKIAQEKKRLLQKELREVSIRVNLFEKIMIPRALENIKKIKIFLGDQLLAAVSQAKVAKKKILLREEGGQK
jgi:V/A-type H+/Na+-transporting ATPase subunit D